MYSGLRQVIHPDLLVRQKHILKSYITLYTIYHICVLYIYYTYTPVSNIYITYTHEYIIYTEYVLCPRATSTNIRESS